MPPRTMTEPRQGIERRAAFAVMAKSLHNEKDIFADPVAAFSAGRFGMWLLLASLGMLFAASILAYVILRLQLVESLDEAPNLPGELWISSVLLLTSSGTMHGALLAARRGIKPAISAALLLSLLLGLAFLASQWLAWREIIVQHEAMWDTLATMPRYMIASFYVMTALHAAHVIGGLIPLALITARSFMGRYDAAHHAGVFYCGMYWHFLDGVWIVLFITLLLGT